MEQKKGLDANLYGWILTAATCLGSLFTWVLPLWEKHGYEIEWDDLLEHVDRLPFQFIVFLGFWLLPIPIVILARMKKDVSIAFPAVLAGLGFILMVASPRHADPGVGLILSFLLYVGVLVACILRKCNVL